MTNSQHLGLSSKEIMANISLYCSIMNKEDTFTIKIKEKEIHLPIEIAVSLSTKILEILMNDPTTRMFTIDIEFLDEKSIDVIEEFLTNYSKELDDNILSNDKMILDLANFGYAFGNSLFVTPLKLKYSSTSNIDNLSIQDLINRIEYKFILSKFEKTENKEQNNLNYMVDPEIEYISKHFDVFCKENSFVEWCKNINNMSLLESIFSYQSFCVGTEDSFLLFLLDLCKTNILFSSLFTFAYLEYCSVEVVKQYIVFINDYFQSSKISQVGLSMISCLQRRCTNQIDEKGLISLERHKLQTKHDQNQKKDVYQYQEENPFNGILNNEHQSNNVNIIPSSVERSGNQYDVYNLVLKPIEGKSTCFYTQNIKNSYITFSLKDSSKFIVDGYMIRGNWNTTSYKMKSWVILGQLATSGDWIEIDKKENQNKFSCYEVRYFPIKETQQLTAVKLMQIDETYDGSNKLVIGSFDIYGRVIKKQ